LPGMQSDGFAADPRRFARLFKGKVGGKIIPPERAIIHRHRAVIREIGMGPCAP
jgi:hypothetical protein